MAMEALQEQEAINIHQMDARRSLRRLWTTLWESGLKSGRSQIQPGF